MSAFFMGLSLFYESVSVAVAVSGRSDLTLGGYAGHLSMAALDPAIL